MGTKTSIAESCTFLSFERRARVPAPLISDHCFNSVINWGIDTTTRALLHLNVKPPGSLVPPLPVSPFNPTIQRSFDRHHWQPRRNTSVTPKTQHANTKCLQLSCFTGRRSWIGVVMILPQVHLRKPCYDFTFL